MTISFIPFNITAQGIFLTNEGETRLVSTDHPNFDKVKDAIKSSDWDEVWRLSDALHDFKQAIEGSDFTVVDGLVQVDGEGIPASLSKRILAFVEEDLPAQPLILFWRNLRQNPSYRARNALFSFLDKQGHPITEDGCFIAYKRVNNDFCSFHADPKGKHLSHQVGEYVEMPREDVDDDPSNTCSAGLHVANYNYAANSYYSGSGHLLDVKVNPADVVAIPLDYNGEKMRVCAYEVTAVAEGNRVDENLYKYERPEPEDDNDGYSGSSVYVGDIEIPNKISLAFENIYRLWDDYAGCYDFDVQRIKGGNKAIKDCQRGNEFNIDRQRFDSLDEEEVAGWIFGYAETFKNIRGTDYDDEDEDFGDDYDEDPYGIEDDYNGI